MFQKPLRGSAQLRGFDSQDPFRAALFVLLRQMPNGDLDSILLTHCPGLPNREATEHERRAPKKECHTQGEPKGLHLVELAALQVLPARCSEFLLSPNLSVLCVWDNRIGQSM